MKSIHCRFSSLLAVAVLPAFAGAQVPLVGIAAFAAADPTIGLNRTDFWHIDKAIDGDVATRTFVTPGGNTLPAVVAIDFGRPVTIDRLRCNKFQADTDDNGGTDSMDLRILVTTDTGPLAARSYLPVSGVLNGHLGAELLHATSVGQDGHAVGDVHCAPGAPRPCSPTDSLYWTLTMAPVRATGIAIRFEKVAGFGGNFHHYPVGEFEVYAAARWTALGPGCAGSLPPTRLSCLGLPQTGSALVVGLDNLPASVAFFLTGWSSTNSQYGPLPLEAGAFGMPGCSARVSVDAVVFLAGSGGTTTHSIAIPNANVLVGMLLHCQALVPDAAAGNLLGAVLSDAATAEVGNQ